MYPHDTHPSNSNPTAQSRGASNPIPQPDQIEMPQDHELMERNIPEDVKNTHHCTMYVQR